MAGLIAAINNPEYLQTLQRKPTGAGDYKKSSGYVILGRQKEKKYFQERTEQIVDMRTKEIINTVSSVPVELKSLVSVGFKPTKVVASQSHSFVLDEKGALQAFGYDGYGQLGMGGNPVFNETIQWLPRIHPSLKDVSAIASGSWHTLAIAGGQLFSFGSNSDGQLGQGPINGSISVPQQVGIMKPTHVAAGGWHS
jgi:alpha-tubulin suppressor-like RCC1 family protein